MKEQGSCKARQLYNSMKNKCYELGLKGNGYEWLRNVLFERRY
jgi:hypothetical protein